MRRIALCFALTCSAATGFVACGDDDGVGPPPATPDASADGPSSETSTTPPKEAGPPDKSGPVDPDQAARAAVVLGSCVPDDGIQRILARLYYLRANDGESRTIFDSAIGCLATHGGGCAAVKACTGAELDIVATPQDCVRGCSGDTRTSCDGRLRLREDCARFGETCVSAATDDGPRATCAPAGSPPCVVDDAGATTSRCENGRPTYCASGVVELQGPACADYGLACTTAGCAGTEGACEDQLGATGARAIRWSDGISCSAGMLKACVNRGIATTACDALATSFTCQSVAIDGGPPRAYCGLGAECVPGTARKPIGCDGDSVIVCNAGRTDKIDCKALGFDGCNADAYGCVPNFYTQAAAAVDGG